MTIHFDSRKLWWSTIRLFQLKGRDEFGLGRINLEGRPSMAGQFEERHNNVFVIPPLSTFRLPKIFLFTDHFFSIGPAINHSIMVHRHTLKLTYNTFEWTWKFFCNNPPFEEWIGDSIEMWSRSAIRKFSSQSSLKINTKVVLLHK